MVQNRSKNMARAEVRIQIERRTKHFIIQILASGPSQAAHARPSGLKRHSRGEEAFKEANFGHLT